MSKTTTCRGGCGAEVAAFEDLDPKLDLPDDGLCSDCWSEFFDWKSPEGVKVKFVGLMAHPLAVDAWLQVRAP